MTLTLATSRRRTITATTIVTPRGRLAALEAGPAAGCAALGTVVIVPPYLGAKDLYAFAMTIWARAGYRVVAYDQLGQGDSTGPGNPRSYTVSDLAGDLCSVLAQVGRGTPVHVLGHCAGGFIARAAALRQKELVGSLCLLSSGPALADSPEMSKVTTVVGTMRAEGTAALWAVIEQDAPTAGLSPAALARLRNAIDGTSAAFLCGLAESLAAEPFLADELSRLPMPKLAMYGSRDHAWLAETYEVMATRIGAQFVRIEGADHNPLVTHSRLVANVMMSFWQQPGGRL